MPKKNCKKLLLGSPLIAVQVAIYIYMTVYGLKASFEVFKAPWLQWSYSLGILYTLVLLLVALTRTVTTDPGSVSSALIEKLKNQLLLPKQLEKLEKLRGDTNRRQYLLKCLNQAIAKHIARRANSSLTEFAGSIQTDMELLELQPTTAYEAQNGGNVHASIKSLPEVCKFTFCEACQQVMPPRSEHCEFCQQCTLRVDHHCFWMGNCCIGLLNHKYFILYLFYVVYFCVQVAGPFFALFVFRVGIKEAHGEDDIDADGKEMPDNFLAILANYTNEFAVYALACCLMVGLAFMLVYQVVILLLNKTTMEVSMDPRRNPFRHKGVIRNIEMVFGSRKCFWMSPFHSPFPDMKLIGYTPSQRQMMSMGVPIANATSGSRGLDYIQCIIPTIRSV